MPKEIGHTEYRVLSVNDLRSDLPRQLHWVQQTGNRVWVMRHGRLAGALVSEPDCAALDRWEFRTLEDQQRRMQVLWRRWEAVKRGESVEPLPYSFWEGPSR